MSSELKIALITSHTTKNLQCTSFALQKNKNEFKVFSIRQIFQDIRKKKKKRKRKRKKEE
jgi:hypothetical protein